MTQVKNYKSFGYVLDTISYLSNIHSLYIWLILDVYKPSFNAFQQVAGVPGITEATYLLIIQSRYNVDVEQHMYEEWGVNVWSRRRFMEEIH